jgi:hypothetical protein
MLRVSPYYLSDPGAGNERTSMETVTVTELASADELKELFDLDASETGPEDDEDDDESGDEDDGEGGDEGIKPQEIPHG